MVFCWELGYFENHAIMVLVFGQKKQMVISSTFLTRLVFPVFFADRLPASKKLPPTLQYPLDPANLQYPPIHPPISPLE